MGSAEQAMVVGPGFGSDGRSSRLGAWLFNCRGEIVWAHHELCRRQLTKWAGWGKLYAVEIVCSLTNRRWKREGARVSTAARRRRSEDAGARLTLHVRAYEHVLGEQKDAFSKGMILAQNERWRRALNMQVEREIRLRLESKAAKG